MKFIYFFCITIFFAAPSFVKAFGRSDLTCTQEIQGKLGQLFFVGVYDLGDEDGVVPASYKKLISNLQVGAILPHLASMDYQSLKKTLDELKSLSQLPLLVGVDGITLTLEKEGEFLPLFHGFFFLPENGGSDCLDDLSWINAFALKASGINWSLGPVVEQSTKGIWKSDFLSSPVDYKTQQSKISLRAFEKLGVATTLKHYPYTPESYSLHKMSKEESLLERDVRKKEEIFQTLSGDAPFLMTTHIYNPAIDDTFVTFSSKWVDRIRDNLNFKGIIVTDGLFMMDNYKDSMQNMLNVPEIKQAGIANRTSFFAIRSILSGHDMVLLEGSSSTSYQVFSDVLKFACLDGELSIKLKSRILESYKRIINFKKQKREDLMFSDLIDPSDIYHVLNLLKRYNRQSDRLSCDVLKKSLQPIREKY